MDPDIKSKEVLSKEQIKPRVLILTADDNKSIPKLSNRVFKKLFPAEDYDTQFLIAIDPRSVIQQITENHMPQIYVLDHDMPPSLENGGQLVSMIRCMHEEFNLAPPLIICNSARPDNKASFIAGAKNLPVIYWDKPMLSYMKNGLNPLIKAVSSGQTIYLMDNDIVEVDKFLALTNSRNEADEANEASCNTVIAAASTDEKAIVMTQFSGYEKGIIPSSEGGNVYVHKCHWGEYLLSSDFVAELELAHNILCEMEVDERGSLPFIARGLSEYADTISAREVSKSGSPAMLAPPVAIEASAPTDVDISLSTELQSQQYP